MLVDGSCVRRANENGQRAEKELTLETSDLLYGGNLPLLDCFDAKFSSNTSNSGMLAN